MGWTTVRILVGEHDARATDLDLSMTDVAPRAEHAHDFLRTERLLVELDRRGAAAHAQVRRDRVIALRDRRHLALSRLRFRLRLRFLHRGLRQLRLAREY